MFLLISIFFFFLKASKTVESATGQAMETEAAE